MPTDRPYRRRSPLARMAPFLVLLVGAAVVVVAVGIGLSGGHNPFRRTGCSASVGGRSVSLSEEQGRNAALVTAVAVRRGLPPRAASIALAAALQESKLRNLSSGDLDSLGLFQQRPSQGWGTPAQIRDPWYATNRFYDALVQVPGYTAQRITVAAQEVQRSGYPSAYAAHARDARDLASALTGYSPAAFTCQVAALGSLPRQSAPASGLTPRATRVRAALDRAFGTQSVVVAAPTSFRVVSGGGAAGRRSAWSAGQYAVALATRLPVTQVQVGHRVWTRSRSSDGWRRTRSGVPSGSVEVGVAAG